MWKRITIAVSNLTPCVTFWPRITFHIKDGVSLNGTYKNRVCAEKWNKSRVSKIFSDPTSELSTYIKTDIVISLTQLANSTSNWKRHIRKCGLLSVSYGLLKTSFCKIGPIYVRREEYFYVYVYRILKWRELKRTIALHQRRIQAGVETTSVPGCFWANSVSGPQGRLHRDLFLDFLPGWKGSAPCLLCRDTRQWRTESRAFKKMIYISTHYLLIGCRQLTKR